MIIEDPSLSIFIAQSLSSLATTCNHLKLACCKLMSQELCKRTRRLSLNWQLGSSTQADNLGCRLRWMILSARWSTRLLFCSWPRDSEWVRRSTWWWRLHWCWRPTLSELLWQPAIRAPNSCIFPWRTDRTFRNTCSQYYHRHIDLIQNYKV